MESRIEFSSPEDLDEILGIHCRCFPESFGVRMGKKFARKTLEWFLSGENKMMIHVRHQNRITAYVGCLIPQRTGEGSTSGIISFALRTSAACFIKKPNLLFHKSLRPIYRLILKNAFRKIVKRKSLPSIAKDDIPLHKRRLKVVAIGIDPAFRGKGVVDSIFCFLENLAAEKGYEAVSLSVKKENQRAIKAYRRNGLLVEKEGIEHLEMKKNIHGVEAKQVAFSGSFCER